MTGLELTKKLLSLSSLDEDGIRFYEKDLGDGREFYFSEVLLTKRDETGDVVVDTTVSTYTISMAKDGDEEIGFVVSLSDEILQVIECNEGHLDQTAERFEDFVKNIPDEWLEGGYT